MTQPTHFDRGNASSHSADDHARKPQDVQLFDSRHAEAIEYAMRALRENDAQSPHQLFQLALAHEQRAFTIFLARTLKAVDLGDDMDTPANEIGPERDRPRGD
ncbi:MULTISPECIES: hypothetical protein [unclassified Burkholderia]|uniref:hypothetical protein n=1 Tax=unclassified Burkholderia TaxID=2613784 RepID=UPI002AB1092A|nr:MULTISPECIES: hypothetical protein [unclassified Burkholderia]